MQELSGFAAEFLLFLLFEIDVPKCSLPVGTSEGKIFSKDFWDKPQKRVCISAPFVQMSEEVFSFRNIFPFRGCI